MGAALIQPVTSERMCLFLADAAPEEALIIKPAARLIISRLARGTFFSFLFFCQWKQVITCCSWSKEPVITSPESRRISSRNNPPSPKM